MLPTSGRTIRPDELAAVRSLLQELKSSSPGEAVSARAAKVLPHLRSIAARKLRKWQSAANAGCVNRALRRRWQSVARALRRSWQEVHRARFSSGRSRYFPVKKLTRVGHHYKSLNLIAFVFDDGRCARLSSVSRNRSRSRFGSARDERLRTVWFFRDARWRCIMGRGGHSGGTGHGLVSGISSVAPLQLPNSIGQSASGFPGGRSRTQAIASYLDEFALRSSRHLEIKRRFCHLISSGRRQFQAWLEPPALRRTFRCQPTLTPFSLRPDYRKAGMIAPCAWR